MEDRVCCTSFDCKKNLSKRRSDTTSVNLYVIPVVLFSWVAVLPLLCTVTHESLSFRNTLKVDVLKQLLPAPQEAIRQGWRVRNKNVRCCRYAICVFYNGQLRCHVVTHTARAFRENLAIRRSCWSNSCCCCCCSILRAVNACFGDAYLSRNAKPRAQEIRPEKLSAAEAVKPGR